MMLKAKLANLATHEQKGAGMDSNRQPCSAGQEIFDGRLVQNTFHSGTAENGGQTTIQ